MRSIVLFFTQLRRLNLQLSPLSSICCWNLTIRQMIAVLWHSKVESECFIKTALPLFSKVFSIYLHHK